MQNSLRAWPDAYVEQDSLRAWPNAYVQIEFCSRARLGTEIKVMF
jgi:hypothetical protein